MVWFGCAWMRFDSAPARRTFALATGLQNYGYVPLPLTLRVPQITVTAPAFGTV